MIQKIIMAFKCISCLLRALIKRITSKQIYYLISTPFYGNVGDHTIELAQKEILNCCQLEQKLIEFTSCEYKHISAIT